MASKERIVFLICAAVFLGVIGIATFAKTPASQIPKTTQQPQEKPSAQETSDEEIIGKQAFKTSIEPFENLTAKDVPHFSDVRSLFEYEGHYIAVGFSTIMEFDADDGVLFRVSNDVLPNIDSATIIDNYLYVGANGNFTDRPVGEVYKINLDTGIIEDVIVGEKDVPSDLLNVEVTSSGTDLWIVGGLEVSTVYKWDTKANQLAETYTADDAANEEGYFCGNPLRFVFNKNSVQIVDFVCNHFISTYDYDSNSWAVEKFTKLDPDDYINKNERSFDVTIPNFYAVTKLVDNRYYVVASDGIYTLNKNQLPVRVVNVDLAFTNGTKYATFNVANNTVLLIEFNTIGGDGSVPFLKDHLSVRTIDLGTGVVTDLISLDGKYSATRVEELETNSVLRSDLELVDTTESTLVLKNYKDGPILMEIKYNPLELFIY